MLLLIAQELLREDRIRNVAEAIVPAGPLRIAQARHAGQYRAARFTASG